MKSGAVPFETLQQFERAIPCFACRFLLISLSILFIVSIFRMDVLESIMCFISTLFRVIPNCPLLVLSNREEMRSRPATPPKVISKSGNAACWLGGIDSQAGGTWLGLNEYAMVVAVTNRPQIHTPSDVRSRGLLCRDLLECHSLDEALEKLDEQLQHHRFAGFNVLLLTAKRAMLVESGDDYEMKHLCPGIHTITNGTLNDPDDARILRAQTELRSWEFFDTDIGEMVNEAKTICGLTDERDETGICITGEEWGTVSSTILGLTENLAEAFYWHASGPPANTHYDDYSGLLRELLNSHD